jgi:hypothetical protein
MHVKPVPLVLPHKDPKKEKKTCDNFFFARKRPKFVMNLFVQMKNIAYKEIKPTNLRKMI